MDADAAVGLFAAERPRLLGLAYRLLGSRADADDVVQDAWLAWAGADHAAIERPPAWLTTVTTRLALDRLRSAQHRRETYVGPWLPEPVVTDGPEQLAELAESLTLGFLTLLETLQPVERVVLVLADVYGVPFADIAETVGRTPDACRQIASRARRRVQAGVPRLEPRDDAARVAAELVLAVGAGDVDAVTRLLADDVVLLSDGGADRHAARRPVVGPERVTRFLVNLARRLTEVTAIEPIVVNGQPGLVGRLDGRPILVMAFEVVAGRVHRLHAVVNPDKLAGFDLHPDLL